MISLGMNSWMFGNCLVFCDVWHVRRLVLGHNVMFGSVRSSVLLLCDQTSLATYYRMMFAKCLVFCDVWHVRNSIFFSKMGCLKSFMFRHSMFGVFEVWYFGVHSNSKGHHACFSSTIFTLAMFILPIAYANFSIC